MKCIQHQIKGTSAYLLPISDTHIGDRNFDRKSLQGYLDWVDNEPNARIFLNGDIINVAGITTASSVFDQEADLNTQIEMATNIFMPYKNKILGAISGNHEQRLEKAFGYNPMIPICHNLGVKYLGYSAIVDIKLITGRFKRTHHEIGETINYTFFCHHTTGGGGTVGGKMNRVDMLRKLVSNADAYIGSHNHQLGIIPVESRHYSAAKKGIVVQRQILVDSGSFLKWNDSYAEKMQLVPSKIGAVRIRMDGLKKDLHCSL